MIMLNITENPPIKFASAEHNHRQTVPEYKSPPPFCRDGSNLHFSEKQQK